MNREEFFTFIHNILGLVHSLITAVVACYLVPHYIADPLGVLSGPDYNILWNTIFFSICYFFVSSFFVIFLEPYTKKTPQYMLHHFVGLLTQITVLVSNRYINLSGACHFMEISTVLLCIRSILRDLHIKGKITIIVDIIFVISFIACRFTVPFYMFYNIVISVTQRYNDGVFMMALCLSSIMLVLNLVWVKEMAHMIKKHIFGTHIQKPFISSSKDLVTCNQQTNNQNQIEIQSNKKLSGTEKKTTDHKKGKNQ